jgi:hypothetical protein
MLKRYCIIIPTNQLDSSVREQIIMNFILARSIHPAVRMPSAAKKTAVRALIEIGKDGASSG